MTIDLDRFAHLDSVIHRWDPRWKLGTLFLLMVSLGVGGVDASLSAAEQLPPLLAGAALSGGVLWCSRIPLGAALFRLRYAAVFLGCIVLAYSFRWSADGFEWSPQGAKIGSLIALRAGAVVLLVLPAFATARFTASLHALRALRVPAPLVQVFLFTYRYIFVYSDEVRRVRTAMRARGFEPRFSRATATVFGRLIGLLVLGAIERTQAIRTAMISRGFTGTIRSSTRFRTRAGDIALSGALISCGVMLAVWRSS